MMHKVHRYHDICAGHRVVGHEGKCQHLHGHNYRVHFTCIVDQDKLSKELAEPYSIHNAETPGVLSRNTRSAARQGLDTVGRVIDFSVVKEKLCMWLEEEWDHKFIAYDNDPLINSIHTALGKNGGGDDPELAKWTESIVRVPFNPTAENMAQYLVEVVGPKQLEGTGVILTEVRIEETAKCHVTYGV